MEQSDVPSENIENLRSDVIDETTTVELSVVSDANPPRRPHEPGQNEDRWACSSSDSSDDPESFEPYKNPNSRPVSHSATTHGTRVSDDFEDSRVVLDSPHASIERDEDDLESNSCDFVPARVEFDPIVEDLEAEVEYDFSSDEDEETPDNAEFAERPRDCLCNACDLTYLKTSIPSAGAYIIEESSSQTIPLEPLQRNTFLYSNRDVYEGEFTANQKHGFGMYFYHNGDTYIGEWRHNRRHSIGTFIRAADGLIYDGCWKEDLRHGFGIQAQKDGTRYCGLYKRNVKEGAGVLVYGSGQLYSGIWEDNSCEYRELLFQTYTAHEMVAFCHLPPKYAYIAQQAEAKMSILSDDHVAAALRHQKKANIHNRDNKYKHAPGAKEKPATKDANTRRSTEDAEQRPVESGGFGRSLHILRHLSSALGLRDWSACMVAHYLRCSGHQARTCRAIIQHDIDGKNISAILGGDSLEEVFLQLGLDLNDSLTLHCITITLSLLLKVRRRQYLREDEVARRLKDKVSHEYRSLEASTVSTEELLLVKRIGEGGFGRVYMGKYYPYAGQKIDGDGDEEIDPRAAAHNSNFLDAANTGDVMTIPDSEHTLAVDVAVKVFRPTVQPHAPRGNNKLRLDTAAALHGGLLAIQQAAARDFYTEFSILSRLRHPNITLFIGAVLKPLFCLVTEYVACGSLFDIIHRKHYKFELSKIFRIAHDICCGMAYLHANGILHCDLKSANILLDSSGEAKICDFGLAVDIHQEAGNYGEGQTTPPLLGLVGTHHWMAPEIMRGEPYSPYSDVYSFGMILWECITCRIPFDTIGRTHIIALVGHGCLGPGIPTLGDFGVKKGAEYSRNDIDSNGQNTRGSSGRGRSSKSRYASLASLLQSVGGDQQSVSGAASYRWTHSVGGRNAPSADLMRPSSLSKGLADGVDRYVPAVESVLEDNDGDTFVFRGGRRKVVRGTWGRPDTISMWRNNPHKLTPHQYLGYTDSGVLCAAQTLINVVRACTDWKVGERPDFETLTEVFRILQESSVVHVEENIVQFFGT